ncbi:YraN family protein [Anaerococcus urinomassiliensis]|uniref:YraN family protein n=1 Tax=Anaerococcus urinomassiliensis TaxID=1745712 RepID=UPI00093EFB50|nr:YraN family protein [Anaerococcus urinomassiliensis]
MNEKRKIGDFGEDLAVSYMSEKGYEILSRNYLKPYGEIDIVAIKDDIICFVEVKTRKSSNFAYPREAVNYHKQQRIIKASQMYMMENNINSYLMRFDVVEVFTESRKINYIENAF